ncbi:MAG: hypothetical protein A2234_02205 [Elusimicrobia bacterium RIFOXYA2_FULL_58_8]|nr:MAG: hypothetical protein A2234_02205 [Elusimicrobia bacterium RIFOXYA2_FULL_58_8]
MLTAARRVFPSVELIPGARLTVLAGLRAHNLSPARLAEVYLRRGIKNTVVIPSAFPFILDPARRAWAVRELGRIKLTPLNTDLSPLAYFHFWRSWLSMVVSPGALLGLAALALAALCAALALAGRLAFTARERTGEAFFMGFWGMAFQTALLLAFQAKTGRLNPELGALLALFMAASAAGAMLAGNAGRRKLLALETAAAALALACALAAGTIFADSSGAPVWALITCGGLITGAFFALAAGTQGGSIYAWDLLGGAAGGFTTAAFAAPILGIKGALLCAALAALCAVAGNLWSGRKAGHL